MAFLQPSSWPLALCLAFFQATYLAWLCFNHLAGPRSWDWLYHKPRICLSLSCRPSKYFSQKLSDSFVFLVPWLQESATVAMLPAQDPCLYIQKVLFVKDSAYFTNSSL